MSIRLRSGLGASVLAIAGAAGSAQATFFSFASDVNDQLPTFQGTAASGGSFTITSPANNKFDLLIDDDNGSHPSLSVPVSLQTNLTASYNSMAGFGSYVTYNYGITGTVDFVDQNTGGLLLRISVGVGATPAVMTVPGTSNSWSTAGAIIGSDQFTSNLVYNLSQAGYNAFATAATNAGQSISNYDIIGPGNSQGPNDFGFTLTVLRQPAQSPQSGLVVSLGADHNPNVAWQSESSYSGSSGTFIPAPTSVALLGLGGLIAGRRRRA